MDEPDHRLVLKAWRALTGADLIYKAIAFTVLTPLIGVLLRGLIGRTGATAVADADIAFFLFTTRSGALALFLVLPLIIGVTALEQACLMTIVLTALRGGRARLRDAFAHGAKNAFAIVRVTLLLVVRLLVLAAPFVALIGVTYWALLSGHDINFYLTGRPPAFWTAVAIAAAIVGALAAVLVRKAAQWLLVLPLVVFEDVRPVHAFAESKRRMAGRLKGALALAAWVVLAIAVPLLTTSSAKIIGRTTAPLFSGSMAGLLLFVSVFLIVWGAVSLAVGIALATTFAWIVVREYAANGGASAARLPEPFHDELTIEGRRWRVSWPVMLGTLVGAVGLAALAAYLLMGSAWSDRAVLIFAHRGAAAEAPENTLAAFRLAGEQRTDYVELDVQESRDGVVVVVHDADLMKVGSSPLKIWEAPAEQLRQVDIGSHFDPKFKNERVPTLAEALEACKGASRVDIELKYYGHNERLAERVVEIVEAARMENSIVTMSLNRDLVDQMKRLRPAWTAGLLTAKAIGDLTHVPADFLAVEKSMATRRFIRAAHRAGKPVYAWTVDDPARMVRLIGLGVDGLITNRPGVAREVLDRFKRMTQAERLFLFVMITLGAEKDVAAPENELRP